MKNTYTFEEVINLLVAERQRAVDICYESKEKHDEDYKNKKIAGNQLAFVSDTLSNECRELGNFISGGNALSAALGETMRDRILQNFDLI